MSGSFLYVIGPENEGPVKIGFSKHPEKRLKSIQTGHPEKLILHHKTQFDQTKIRLVERKIHNDLSYKKVNGEWFNITPEEACDWLDYMLITYEDVSAGVMKLL
mgnify:CR=1 FL=1|tara:strand:- start:4748 stop:5059 length:312 start_codon:yes stop_codon:yes gene_type:complete